MLGEKRLWISIPRGSSTLVVGAPLREVPQVWTGGTPTESAKYRCLPRASVLKLEFGGLRSGLMVQGLGSGVESLRVYGLVFGGNLTKSARYRCLPRVRVEGSGSDRQSGC